MSKKPIVYEKKLRKLISSSIKKNRIRTAISAASALAYYLYTVNQTFVDEDIEDAILEISRRTKRKEHDYSLPFEKRESEFKVLFYDGFGLENRGLVKIYLSALTKKYHIIYITKKSKKNDISTIDSIIKSGQGDVFFYSDDDYLKAIEEINYYIYHYNPNRIFIYTTPFDISSMIAFSQHPNIIRYLINLTDHAFWSGIESFDYCIEFRKFGASISNLYRGISIEKLLLLPFYPYYDEMQRFEGYPFDYEDKFKIVFSGGALYKTMGSDNLYYKMVERILEDNRNVVFWYAGSGDNTNIKALMNAFPRRVFYTKERADLFAVMRHVDVYLSTYPVLGGLMLQYAAVAEKIPVTLVGSQISDDFLINQESLGIFFYNVNDAVDEINKLLRDDQYRVKKEKKVKESVISKHKFEANLFRIVEKQESIYEIIVESIDVEKYQKEYKQYINYNSIACAIAQANNKELSWYFPECFIYKIIRKMKGLKNEY